MRRPEKERYYRLIAGVVDIRDGRLVKSQDAGLRRILAEYIRRYRRILRRRRVKL